METTSLEASKILQEYIPEKVKYFFGQTEGYEWQIHLYTDYNWSFRERVKTLTLEEAIDMLPAVIEYSSIKYDLEMGKKSAAYRGVDKEIFIQEKKINVQYYNLKTLNSENKETLLIAVEKMLLYLHDNNLLK